MHSVSHIQSFFSICPDRTTSQAKRTSPSRMCRLCNTSRRVCLDRARCVNGISSAVVVPRRRLPLSSMYGAAIQSAGAYVENIQCSNTMHVVLIVVQKITEDTVESMSPSHRLLARLGYAVIDQ